MQISKFSYEPESKMSQLKKIMAHYNVNYFSSNIINNSSIVGANENLVSEIYWTLNHGERTLLNLKS